MERKGEMAIDQLVSKSIACGILMCQEIIIKDKNGNSVVKVDSTPCGGRIQVEEANNRYGFSINFGDIQSSDFDGCALMLYHRETPDSEHILLGMVGVGKGINKEGEIEAKIELFDVNGNELFSTNPD